jgi:MarR family transcriptional regulator, transcriptional regulator for hemolysin
MKKQTPGISQTFGFRIALITRRLRQLVDDELRDSGLTEATWRPLVYLERHREGIRQKDLASALGIEGPSLVHLLDSLERRGLIERREDEADRRARRIYLTPRGRDLQKWVFKVSETVQQRLLAAVGAADLEACDRAFKAIEAMTDVPLKIASAQ